jgi:hypothetical protein
MLENGNASRWSDSCPRALLGLLKLRLTRREPAGLVYVGRVGHRRETAREGAQEDGHHMGGAAVRWRDRLCRDHERWA